MNNYHYVFTDEEDALLLLSGKPNSKQRLWALLINRMKKGNLAKLPQEDIVMYSSELTTLTNLGLIFLLQRGRNKNTYILNPSYVWCGDEKGISRAVAKYTELIKKQRGEPELPSPT